MKIRILLKIYIVFIYNCIFKIVNKFEHDFFILIVFLNLLKLYNNTIGQLSIIQPLILVKVQTTITKNHGTRGVINCS